jgi:hypothetical protein
MHVVQALVNNKMEEYFKVGQNAHHIKFLTKTTLKEPYPVDIDLNNQIMLHTRNAYGSVTHMAYTNETTPDTHVDSTKINWLLLLINNFKPTPTN